MKSRCEWAGSDPLYLAYHDEEWGVPARDDHHLFEMLVLEGAQAGLSWLTILRKRENYRRAFHDFDPGQVAAFSPADVARLLADPGIVRNRLKIAAAVNNAGRVLEIVREFGSFGAFLWRFVDHHPRQNAWRSLREVPARTEQSDLMQAMYGRNGESPMVVVAPRSPADCFETIFEACRIALEHMIPVMFLSDGYLANGSEQWKFPQASDLKKIDIRFESPRNGDSEEPFLPYLRDERYVRSWAIPGTEGIEHRVGGLEKEDLTGNVSYDPDNHEKMVNLRKAKRDRIAEFIPSQDVDQGSEKGEVAILGWGSTYGSIRTSVFELRQEGVDVSHIHLRYISPFPKNLGELLSNYEQVIVPEINDGQLIKLIRDEFLIPAKGINKIQGRPFGVEELKEEIPKRMKAGKHVEV